ncbi:MAG: aminoglycoside phosphotransferase family protein [Lysinibacillus sp.]
MKIKDNCWKISGQTGSYFLKKYRSRQTFEKVAELQRALQPKLPFLVPALAFEEPFIVYKWLSARAADYNDIADCREVFQMLQMFHKEGQQLIDVAPPLQLEAKWHYRLHQFESLQPTLQPMLGRFYDDLVRISEFTLLRAPFPKGEMTLLHGDVAHHNFLFSKDKNEPYMIDLDLAVVGTPAEEIILWLHRLLPHFHYDLVALLEALPELEAYSPYFGLLLFPNEILREWLFFYEHEDVHPYLRAMTVVAIERWPSLHQQIEALQV